MLLDRTNHNRFAEQLTRRFTDIVPVAQPINAVVTTVDAIVPATDRTVSRTDNNPPSRLDYAREALGELSTFLKDNPVITDQAQAKTGSAIKERTLIALNEARAEREIHTKPLRERLNAIFSTYELVKDKGALETVYGELRKRLTKYATAIEDARIAEANRLRAEAEQRERLAREAEAAEAEAIANAEVGEVTDVGAAIEQADEAFSDFKTANRQAAIAERSVPVRFTSVMGGRSQAMRTAEVLVVENLELAIKTLGLTDKIKEAILSSARDYRKAHEELPAGITATFERRM